MTKKINFTILKNWFKKGKLFQVFIVFNFILYVATGLFHKVVLNRYIDA